MILVTAADGNQGRLLVPKLVAAGHPVRAVVRTERSAARLRAIGVGEVVVGDLAETRVERAAVAGVDTGYDVGATLSPGERAMGFGIIDADRAAGVEHLVLSSPISPSSDPAADRD